MTKKKRNGTSIALLDKYILRTKFQKRALVPQEAIDKNWMGIHCSSLEDKVLKESAIFVTSDGCKVNIRLMASCNNSKGDEAEWLQDICREIYDLKFEIMQSHWFARLGDLSGYWHLIEMEKVR